MRRTTGRRDVPEILKDWYQRIQALERYSKTVPLQTFRLVSAASTNASSMVVGPCAYYGHYISNANHASMRFVHIYDKASAPTGADTPKLTLGIPFDSGANQEYANGVEFDNGIAVAFSTSATSLVAVAANELVVTVMYAL